MSRLRVWILTAVVALGLAANLGLLSPRIAQTAEDGLRARLAASAAALRAQLDLLDARLAPRGLAQNVDLVDALRPPAEGAPPSRPDERALRAAAAVAAPDPDLLAVAGAGGAVVSRRGRPAQQLDDAGALPPLKALLEGGSGSPTFVQLDRQLYRVAGARVPGNAGAVLAGALIDDRFASTLRTLLDAEVGFFAGGTLAASSHPAGQRRDELIAWRKSPGPGYGQLELNLPVVGRALEGLLPLGAQRFAVRGALVPLDSGVQAALTLPAAPYFGWLARYQAAGLLLLALVVLGGFVWGLLARGEPKKHPAPSPEQQPQRPRHQPRKNQEERLQELVDQEEPEVGPIHVRPRNAEASGPPPRAGSSRGAAATPTGGEAPGRRKPETAGAKKPPDEGASPLAHGAAPRLRAPESLDPEVPPPGSELVASPAAEAGIDPVWGADLLSASGAAFAPPPAQSAAPGTFDEPWDAPAPAPRQPARSSSNSRPPAVEARKPAAAAPSDLGDSFPGDEPTRVEPVSAELLDRLRAADDAASAPTAQKPSAPAARMPAAPPPAAEDPDEAHFQDTFEKFVALRAETGEGASNVSYEKFAAKLRKNRQDLLAKHSARGVRFMVYIKDGKAAIKASAIR